MTDFTTVSLVILTYNRPHLIARQLERFAQISYPEFELIIVDNHSEQPLADMVKPYPFARLLRMEENLGVAGRNRGMAVARGEIVITLDDDVTGITDQDINRIVSLFSNATTGAVCFKVLDEETGEVINWCHHRKLELYCDQAFITDEISEGAVAFRRTAVLQAGLYPEEFFISHEGPDLALRIMNCGYDVIYNPAISVLHSHAVAGRPGWRRYYYDTRNLIWLVLRNHQFLRGARKLGIGLGSMLVYSLRDGFLRYWFKGVVDGVMGSKKMLSQRIPVTCRTQKILREIDRFRPGMWYMLKKRLLKKKVRI
jgi:GT2 family glycosyltransferase